MKRNFDRQRKPPAKIQTRPFPKPERIENTRPYGNKPIKARNNTILERSYDGDTIIKTNEENERNKRQLSSIISENGRDINGTKTPDNGFKRNIETPDAGSIKRNTQNQDNGSIREKTQVSNEDHQRRRRNSSENGNRKESPRDARNNNNGSLRSKNPSVHSSNDPSIHYSDDPTIHSNNPSIHSNGYRNGSLNGQSRNDSRNGSINGRTSRAGSINGRDVNPETYRKLSNAGSHTYRKDSSSENEQRDHRRSNVYSDHEDRG